MLHSKPLLIVILLALLCEGAVPNPVRGAQDLRDPLSGKNRSGMEQDQGGIRLNSSTTTGVSFEVRVPSQDVAFKQVTTGGKTYVQVSIPGWATTSQAGAPVVPYQVVEIGAPFGAGVSVQVTPGRMHRLELGSAVLPAGRQEVLWDPNPGSENRPLLNLTVSEDLAVYTAEALYPGKLAEIAGDGVLRQQRVISIASYPLQVHPLARELILYESLLVEVTFTGPAPNLQAVQRAESGTYDRLLSHHLLNSAIATGWRQPNLLVQQKSGTQTKEGLPWAPPEPGWRIKVRKDGFYCLTYTELQTAGLPVDQLDPHTFQLFYRGVEAAIEVSGEADGHFDPADSILFYGQAVNSKYTPDNVYWLTYGQAPGLRMDARDGTPGSAQTLEVYTTRRRLEENHYYVPGMQGDDRLERWIWDYLYPPSRPQWSTTFSLTDPSPNPAKLTIALLGYLQDPINPDHHATISLNGEQVGDVWWDGVGWHVMEMDLPAGLLKAGANTLTVRCPNDTGVGHDVVYVDWADLEFANRLTASGDVLTLANGSAGAWRYTITGFENTQVSVYDISDPLAVMRIENVSVVPAGLQYSAQFQDEATTPKAYQALSVSAFLSVQSIEQDTPSNLTDPENGADYILITHQDFMTATATLRDFRASQGLRAQLVDVQDVYDQFGYGIISPESIHDFLAYAYQYWQAPSPSYVVLVGDGHYDPKDYSGYGRLSYIPPFLAMADPWIGETAADNRYVTITGGDYLPDMMLGRLSVNSTQEANAFIEKIISYEQSPTPEDWQHQILLVADRVDGLLDFPQQSDDLINCCLPWYYQAKRVYYGVTHLQLQDAREAIQAEIASGKLLVNYAGHASATRWAADGLFETSDIPKLQDHGKLPVVLAMTCWDGYYQYPNPVTMGWESVAEVITREPGRGAVASWSPTGIGLVSGHRTLNQGFYLAVFQDGLQGLGEATTAGKLDLWATGANLDLVDTFLLFGDPAMQMKSVPVEPPLWEVYLPTIMHGQ